MRNVLKRLKKCMIPVLVLMLVVSNSVCFAQSGDDGNGGDFYVPEQVKRINAEKEGREFYLSWDPVKYATEYRVLMEFSTDRIVPDGLDQEFCIADSGMSFMLDEVSAEEKIGLIEETLTLDDSTTVEITITPVSALGTEGKKSEPIVISALNGKIHVKAPVKTSSSKFTLKNTRATMQSVSMSWTKVSGAKKYEVYRSTSLKGTYKKVCTTTSRKFSDSGLSKSKNYYYKIKAIKGDGTSKMSNTSRKLKVRGNYKKGSIYGPYMSQKKLNKVGDKVANFVNVVIQDPLSDADKVAIAHHYLASICSYAEGEDYNNAYGALVRGRGLCSAYARGFKALCDGMGISCWYVHSNESDHQFNIVKIDGQGYIVDVQLDSVYGVGTGLLRSTKSFQKLSVITEATAFDTGKYPKCSKDFLSKDYYRDRDSYFDVDYSMDGDLWWN